jgi:hypothetical protein
MDIRFIEEVPPGGSPGARPRYRPRGTDSAFDAFEGDEKTGNHQLALILPVNVKLSLFTASL